MIYLSEFEKHLSLALDSEMSRYGYFPKKFIEYKGSRSIFYTKNIRGKVYCNIDIQLLSWTDPQVFQVKLIRNIGDIPKYSIDKKDPNYLEWRFTTIAHLLYTLNKVEEEHLEYNGLFSFNSTDDLDNILIKVKRIIIKYGISWLEKEN
jgi:hypothetical protein